MSKHPISSSDVEAVIEQFNQYGRSLSDPLTIEGAVKSSNTPRSPSYVTHCVRLFDKPLLASMDMGAAIYPPIGVFIAGNIRSLVVLPCDVIVQITMQGTPSEHTGSQLCNAMVGLIKWCNTSPSAAILARLDQCTGGIGLVVTARISDKWENAKIRVGAHLIGEKMAYNPDSHTTSRAFHYEAIARDSAVVKAVRAAANYSFA